MIRKGHQLMAFLVSMPGYKSQKVLCLGRAEINMDIGHEFSIFTLQIKNWA